MAFVLLCAGVFLVHDRYPVIDLARLFVLGWALYQPLIIKFGAKPMFQWFWLWTCWASSSINGHPWVSESALDEKPELWRCTWCGSTGMTVLNEDKRPVIVRVR